MPPPQRIILIDDNEYDNSYHQIIVSRSGFGGELVVIEDGEEAIRYLEEADLTVPTHILLDINMPRMDGFQVAARVAPLLRAKPVTLVMLTSSASPADIERAAGIDIIHGFLTKPLTVPYLKSIIDCPANVAA